MNALDQAFIKAFAKDPAPAARAKQGASELRTLQQPPAEGVESVSLVLHDLYEQGKRLRIDRPNAEATGLDAHMVLPLVDEVQSYDPQDVPGATQPAVLYEDRLAPLEEVLSQADTEQAESDVALGKDASGDMDVPASDLTADRAQQEPEVEHPLPGPVEDPDLDRCQPRAFLAAEQVDAPELMTLELGLACDVELAEGPLPSTLAVLPPDLDLDAVTQAVREQEAREQRLRDMAVTLATQAILEPPSLTTVIDPWEPLAALEPVAPLGDPPPEPEPELEPAVACDEVPEQTSPVVSSDEPFTPAWEVDAFRWPPICQQLDEQTAGRLTQSGDELYVATQDGLKVLAVTSSSRQEGRSTLALALARSAALAGCRVALVDADVSHPELARSLGMEAPCDWHEVMGRGEPLSEAAVTSLGDRVTLFPRTAAVEVPAGPFDELLLTTLRNLRHHFDLTVVDMAPLGELSQAGGRPDEPCSVDMAVVVRNVQGTSEDQCLQTVSALRTLGVPAVGVIENFTGPGEAT